MFRDEERPGRLAVAVGGDEIADQHARAAAALTQVGGGRQQGVGATRATLQSGRFVAAGFLRICRFSASLKPTVFFQRLVEAQPLVLGRELQGVRTLGAQPRLQRAEHDRGGDRERRPRS